MDWGLVGSCHGEGRREAVGLAGERVFALCWTQAREPGCVCVRAGANANPSKGRVGTCRAARTSPWRSRGVHGGGTPGMAFWPPEWPTRPYSMRQRERGVGKFSPRPEIEQGGRVGRLASLTGGGGGRRSWRNPEEGALGLLVPVARRSGTWRCWGTGRRGRSATDSGESRQRSSCVVEQGAWGGEAERRQWR